MPVERDDGNPGTAAAPLAGLRLRDLTPTQQRIGLALAAVVALPFVVAAIQAHADNWYPIGDNGTMLTVSRQVFSNHTPLVGEVASGTRYGAHPFHPGPMVYYVLAPFVEVLGGAVGLLVGAAVISVTSILLIGYVALRTAGPKAALWAWFTTMVMCWSLGGTAFFYPPFKTISALLVITLFLYLCAALVSGHSTLLPLWVLAASFPMAATMRYLLPVAAVAGLTLLLVVALRWRRTAPDGANSSVRQRARVVLTLDHSERRSVLLAALLLALCWWGPVYEAVTNSGGNVRELYRASRTAAESTDGLRLAIGEQARALLFDPVRKAADFATPTTAYVIVAVALLAAAGVIVARKRHQMDRTRWAYVVVAVGALVFMLASLATTPSDEGQGNYRTLAASPVGAFAVFAGGLIIALALHSRFASKQCATRGVAIGALVVVSLAVGLPGPIDASTEPNPWAFEATRGLVEDAAPQLQSDGQWSAWVVGGRTTDTVFIGFKAGLEAEGVNTGIDARAPGLGATLEDAQAPSAGDLLFLPSEINQPGDQWTPIATYEPPGRSVTEANAVADELLAFARDTSPRPLDAFVGALPRLLCPDLAADGFQGDCPAAQELLESDNPLADLPAAIVALVYLVRFGDDTQYPVIDGPKPPDDLLERAARSWDDIPLTVYVLPAAAQQ